jgi:hypothetical protein
VNDSITGAHGDLRLAGRAVREARALLTEALSGHDRVSARLNAAWREHEDAVVRYQKLLVGVLSVLDDCGQLGEEVTVVRDALRTLVGEHGVEPMPVHAGDPFDGERHISQAKVVDVALRPGVVVDVLGEGYQRRSGDTTVVVRPAMVRVSAPETEECDDRPTSPRD